MSTECVECDRIWREYSEATMAHLKLVSKYQVAVIDQDAGALAALEPVVREYDERRALMRKVVLDHESTHRGSGAEAGQGLRY